jgi:hypothetical protein
MRVDPPLSESNTYGCRKIPEPNATASDPVNKPKPRCPFDTMTQVIQTNGFAIHAIAGIGAPNRTVTTFAQPATNTQIPRSIVRSIVNAGNGSEATYNSPLKTFDIFAGERRLPIFSMRD